MEIYLKIHKNDNNIPEMALKLAKTKEQNKKRQILTKFIYSSCILNINASLLFVTHASCNCFSSVAIVKWQSFQKRMGKWNGNWFVKIWIFIYISRAHCLYKGIPVEETIVHVVYTFYQHFLLFLVSFHRISKKNSSILLLFTGKSKNEQANSLNRRVITSILNLNIVLFKNIFNVFECWFNCKITSELMLFAIYVLKLEFHSRSYIKMLFRYRTNIYRSKICFWIFILNMNKWRICYQLCYWLRHSYQCIASDWIGFIATNEIKMIYK